MSHRLSVIDIFQNENTEGPLRWRKCVEEHLAEVDGKSAKTLLRSTVAVRRLEGHPKAFEKPKSEPRQNPKHAHKR